MGRVYNFSAGPSMLPLSVLERAAAEMTDYQGSGQSVMEMSHRSKVFIAIYEECVKRIRQVMRIPETYEVLFLQGGASTQFAMVPLNLLGDNGKADYVLSGQFSTKAYQEACRFGDIQVAASSKEEGFSTIPKVSAADFRQDAAYAHICYNNTIFGTRWPALPDTGNVPLVADISSCICSEPLDVSRFALLYAGAQKNLAPAGVTVVILRKDLIGKAQKNCPSMLDYKNHAENDSMYNTPPAYSIYMMKLVLDWIAEDMGGLEAMQAHNEKKAAILYDFLEGSRLFKGTADPNCRSRMNVTFVTGQKDLDDAFCKACEAAGFVNIKGHRSVGGMRASIYNAMPIEGVTALRDFMADFEKQSR